MRKHIINEHAVVQAERARGRGFASSIIIIKTTPSLASFEHSTLCTPDST